MHWLRHCEREEDQLGERVPTLSVIQTATEAYLSRLRAVTDDDARHALELWASGLGLDVEPIKAVREAIAATEASLFLPSETMEVLARAIALAVASHRFVRGAMSGQIRSTPDADEVISTLTTEEVIATLAARIAPGKWIEVITERRRANESERTKALEVAESAPEKDALKTAQDRAWRALRDSAKNGVEGAVTMARRERQASAYIGSIAQIIRSKRQSENGALWDEAADVFAFAGTAVLVADWSYWEARVIYAPVGTLIPTAQIGLTEIEGTKPLFQDVGTIAGQAATKPGGGCMSALPLALVSLIVSAT